MAGVDFDEQSMIPIESLLNQSSENVDQSIRQILTGPMDFFKRCSRSVDEEER